MIGQSFTVDRGAYKRSKPKRGDIVDFTKPPGEVSPAVADLVKRVIGLPGETIFAQGQVVINGKPIEEPWLLRSTVTTGIATQVVPPNEYFVLGDNRSNSQDSLFFGPVTASEIVGKVMLSGCHG